MTTDLSVLNSHPLDVRIQFKEEGHRYTIDGQSDGWISCTTFIHGFFIPFDADAVISKMRQSRNWSSSKYLGMTAEQIKKQWSDKATLSSTAGTLLHKSIENYYNGIEQTVDSVEWRYFLNFQKEVVEPSGFKPFRTEWLVFDTEFKVSGSIDMVYSKPDGTLAIYDWKRCEEMKTANPYQSGLEPVSHLPDTNYWHYTLQLNVYRYILQKHYGVTVSELALVVLHPNNSSWKIFKLNVLEDEIQEMMETRCSARHSVIPL
jgi:hypothetical protein